jgi:GNAT superfamily N-acetyltransferase
MYSVVAIPLRDALAVRHAAYYEKARDTPLAQARLDCDGNDFTSHFGIYEKGHIVAAGSLTANAPSPRSPADTAFRLRGMAVLPSHQGRGLGAAVLDYALERVAETGGGLVWANIRVAKAGFYEKWGFTMSDDEFFVREGSPMHRYGELHVMPHPCVSEQMSA